MSALPIQLLCAFAIAAMASQALSAELLLKQDDIAIANASGQVACASIAKTDVKSGTEITFIIEGKTQRIISGVVERQATSLECMSLERAMLPQPHYRLKLEKEMDDPFAIGIVLLKPRFIFRRDDRKLVAAFGGKEISYRFRQCASQEGVHSFVFSNEDGIEKPLWHAYYYLAYDTVPTCTKRDIKIMHML